MDFDRVPSIMRLSRLDSETKKSFMASSYEKMCDFWQIAWHVDRFELGCVAVTDKMAPLLPRKSTVKDEKKESVGLFASTIIR